MRTGVARASAGLFLIMLGVIAGGGDATGQVPPLSTLRSRGRRTSATSSATRRPPRSWGRRCSGTCRWAATACRRARTCHFRAGADPRKKNQVSPGLLRVVFQPDEDRNSSASRRPTTASTARGRTTRSAGRTSPSGSSRTPRTASRRSSRTRTTSCPRRACTTRSSARTAGRAPTPTASASGKAAGANVRRVEPRNTPTMINAVFNHRNFWDMRAQNLFNGVNPFGDRDPERVPLQRREPAESPRGAGAARQLEPRLAGGRAADEPVRDVGRRADVPRRRAGASCGSWDGAIARPARRLRGARPLAKQLVHRDDSVLGPLQPLRRSGA